MITWDKYIFGKVEYTSFISFMVIYWLLNTELNQKTTEVLQTVHSFIESMFKYYVVLPNIINMNP